jgi:hypothetical protein
MVKAKEKKKGRKPKTLPSGQFSVSNDETMALLRVRAQYDKELRLHIESAQWEAAAMSENEKATQLEAQLLEMQTKIDKEAREEE